MAKVKKSFVFHSEWLESMKDIPAESVMQLICYINDYSCKDIEPEIEDPTIRVLFKAFRAKIDEDVRKYKNRCKKNSESAQERWNKNKENDTNETKECDCIQTHKENADHDNDYDNDIDINNIKEKNIKKEKTKKSTRFIPPTLEEVKAYCEERHNNVNPQAFIDHYEANGWYRGNTKMKDWKATVRTWETRNYGGSSTPRRSAVSEFFAED